MVILNSYVSHYQRVASLSFSPDTAFGALKSLVALPAPVIHIPPVIHISILSEVAETGTGEIHPPGLVKFDGACKLRGEFLAKTGALSPWSHRTVPGENRENR